MRKSVKWFTEGMEEVLKENDHKGGWDQEELIYLFTRLKEEVKELKKRLPEDWQWDSIKNPTAVIKECHDIANFAHMIADNVKRLEKS